MESFHKTIHHTNWIDHWYWKMALPSSCNKDCFLLHSLHTVFCHYKTSDSYLHKQIVYSLSEWSVLCCQYCFYTIQYLSDLMSCIRKDKQSVKCVSFVLSISPYFPVTRHRFPQAWELFLIWSSLGTWQITQFVWREKQHFGQV